MRRLPRIALLLVALAAIGPVIAGCSDFDPDSLDPFGFNKKKPLPGHRELLFPNGVPGVTQGIPPEYKEGYKAPGTEDLPPGDIDGKPAATAAQTVTRAPTKPVRESNLGKPKPKPKPKRRVVKRAPQPKPAPKAAATATPPKGTTAPWPSTSQPATAQQGTSAPWPSTTPPPQQSQGGWPAASEQGKLAPWPSAPPSGSFSKQ